MATSCLPLGSDLGNPRATSLISCPPGFTPLLPNVQCVENCYFVYMSACSVVLGGEVNLVSAAVFCPEAETPSHTLMKVFGVFFFLRACFATHWFSRVFNFAKVSVLLNSGF